MRIDKLASISCLFAVLLAVSACATSNVQTVHPAGNYTANVNPYGSSGR